MLFRSHVADLRTESTGAIDSVRRSATWLGANSRATAAAAASPRCKTAPRRSPRRVTEKCPYVYPRSNTAWKKARIVAQTPAVPPNTGRVIRPTRGSTANSMNAESPTVAAIKNDPSNRLGIIGTTAARLPGDDDAESGLRPAGLFGGESSPQEFLIGARRRWPHDRPADETLPAQASPETGAILAP